MSKRKIDATTTENDAVVKPCDEPIKPAPAKPDKVGENPDGVKHDEKTVASPCGNDGKAIEAENLALKAEIAGLRGELDAVKAREGELLRELDERRTPDYAAIAADEDFINGYAVRSELIKAKVIADYLRSLSRTSGVRLLGESVGKSALAPLKKPKTLSEAKKLAELYIKD